MTLLWFVTGASLALAAVAVVQARRTAKRLEQLTQNYWELKYQYGELRAQQQRPTGEAAAPASAGAADRARDSFVPLASLKR